MKKILLFAMGAVMAVPSLAQEEDVTSYIKNAGFDADLTWQADGSKKEIVDQSTVLSNRSIAGVAADGSRYALVNPSTPNKRKVEPERTLEATNGFIGVIDGWEVVYPNEDVANSNKCEWLYFGSVPYALGATAIPVADDGDSYLAVPEKPAGFAGDDNVGMLYLRAGWTNSCAYKQVVNLPCAKYRLEYWTININKSSSATAEDLTQIVCRKEVFKDESGTGLSSTEWTKHEFEFTPTAEFTLQFGFKAANSGSGANPIVCIDGIKLYKIGEANRAELLSSDLNDLADECEELRLAAEDAGYPCLAAYISDYVYEIEENIGGDEDAMEAFLKVAKANKAEFEKAIAELENVDAILAKMEALLELNYPGKADFEAAYNKIKSYKEKEIPADDEDVVAEILGAVAEAKEAIKAYNMTQEATIDNPADYSFLIEHPWFINEAAEPSMEDEQWVFPKRYDAETGEDRYVVGSASSPDLNSGGWYNNSTASGGDHRLNWQRDRSCWNAYNTNFTGTVSVGQDLTGLPNGYYYVAADLITQTSCLNDQHVYAKSTTEKKISSATLDIEGWDYNEWSTVSMTTDEKVIVVDGKLTIGAEGTGMGEGTGAAGWFCATNFKLYYLGAATEEDMAAAVKTAFEGKLAEARELAEKMMLKGDKQVLADSIAKYAVAADNASYLEGIEALTAAIAEAQKSEAKYYDYLPTQETLDENPDLLKSKTLLWVKALLDGEYVEDHDAFIEEAKPIAQFAYDYVQGWLACDTATYTEFDATVDLLKNYINTYIPVLNQAVEVVSAANETGKTVLGNLLNSQKAQLIAEMQTLSVINEMIEALRTTMSAVEKQNVYDDPNATDYTAYIVNPNAEAVAGWDIEIGNGDGNGQKSGQWFDDSSTRYFDSYHSQDVTDAETGEVTHIGLENFKFSQLVTSLPNGTYTVGAYVRTPAEGSYIFAGVAADTTFVEIPLNYYEAVNEETGEVEQAVASDKYGPIWEEAKNAVDMGDYTELQYATFNANTGQGRGWKHLTIENVVVSNHELFIGSMCGTASSKASKKFAGGWYSVGGWTLTLTAKGNNDGWAGPIAEGIESVVSERNTVADGIYSLNGLKMTKLQRGLNIVIFNGKAKKVMVK